MNEPDALISQLFLIRNRYGLRFSSEKLNLLNALSTTQVRGKKALKTYYETLLFLIAYPDNKSVYGIAKHSLKQLASNIHLHERAGKSLFNSGLTGTQLCGSFSFEIVKWLRNEYPEKVILDSIEADDGQIMSVLSVVMPKVESEILQDANTTWKSWLKKTASRGDDMLDRLIALFEQTDIRPEVKDELWTALRIFVEIDLSMDNGLPDSLITPYYHHSIIKKNFTRQQMEMKPVQIQLNEREARQIIECGRMILIRHIREIDPVSFAEAHSVSYYHLSRGISIALMQMIPERRHPVDSYFGYVAFKNGLPVAYAGSWILFDSARIGLNIFPAYRGGESQFIFQQILKLHSKVYRLNRFSVDPYQIGKDNSDGIKSGAFWTYYHAGFRPLKQLQKKIAETEAQKIKDIRGYRSPSSILNKLADSRLELILQNDPVRFDATDLSKAYAALLKKKWNNDRKDAEAYAYGKLTGLLQLKNCTEEKLQFILKNWCVLLLSNEQELRRNRRLIEILKKLFELKARGDEEGYVFEMQRAKMLRKFIGNIIKENVALNA